MLRLILSALVLASTMIAQPHAQASPQRGEPRAPRSTSVVVNLNTATTAELEQLPGIGPKTAARIVDYRQKKGPFKKIEESLEILSSCLYLLNISDVGAH